MAERTNQRDEVSGSVEHAREILDEQEELAWAIVDQVRPLLQLLSDPADEAEAPLARAALSDEERDQIGTVADAFAWAPSDEASDRLDAEVIAARLRSALARPQHVDLLGCVIDAIDVLQREIDHTRQRFDRRLVASHAALAPRRLTLARR